jgi:anti-sigma-K factor RskA
MTKTALADPADDHQDVAALDHDARRRQEHLDGLKATEADYRHSVTVWEAEIADLDVHAHVMPSTRETIDTRYQSRQQINKLERQRDLALFELRQLEPQIAAAKKDA